MWKVIILYLMGLGIAQKVTYDNYKVFEITTSSKMQDDFLIQLTEFPGFTLWKPLTDGQVVLMVASDKLCNFSDMMSQINAFYEIVFENVQSLIDQTLPPNTSMKFDFKHFHTLDTIYKNLDELAQKYPDKVQTVVGGETYEGRKIKGVKVSFKDNNPGIFIEGGIHACEWISPATVMYILHQLLISTDPEIREMAESHNWYIFPVFNPDGYTYAHTSDRLWRKTRSKQNDSDCYGTDPNRNWGYKWRVGDSDNCSCSHIYPGIAPFSEIETKSMSKFIDSIANEIFSYISFHSFSNLLMFPYGYTKEHFDDYDDMYGIAKKSVEALEKRYGTKYTVGDIAETIYHASGGSVDWVKGTYGINLTFIYELRDGGYYGTLLPPSQIVPTGEEIVDSFVALFKEALKRGYPRK